MSQEEVKEWQRKKKGNFSPFLPMPCISDLTLGRWWKTQPPQPPNKTKGGIRNERKEDKGNGNICTTSARAPRVDFI